MDWSYSLTIAILIMLVLFFGGIPVFVSFLAVNLAGVLAVMGTSGFGLFANSLYQSVTTSALAAVPMFIVMGEILFRSGAVDILVQAMDKVIGRVKGRDYFLVMALSTVFGALCGSAVAVAALLGRTIMPNMLKRGYDLRLTSGSILGGATLAAIIPPSMAVVILGSLVDVSIAGLLIAGIVPGVLLACLVAVYTRVRIAAAPELEGRKETGSEARISFGERVAALSRILPFSLVIFFVMGLIMLGVATPSESAATGVAGAMIVAAIYRKLTYRMILEATLSSAIITSMLMAILLTSKLFGQLLAFIGASAGLMKAVAGLDLAGGWMFLLLMAVPFFLCMFIDLFAVMMVAIPIYLPLLKVYGFDPIWFWMLFLINLALGSMTPPFGYTLFSLKAAAPSTPLGEIYTGAWPIMMVYLFGMTVMFFFPSIVTWLPRVF